MSQWIFFQYLPSKLILNLLEVKANGIKRRKAKTPKDTKGREIRSFMNTDKIISFSKNKNAKKCKIA